MIFVDEFVYGPVADRKLVHKMGSGLLPLCWQGEPEMKSFLGDWDNEKVTCKKCLEWMHA